MMKIRIATEQDSEDIWRWRNDPHSRAMFRCSDPVEWVPHRDWFQRMLSSKRCWLLLGVDESGEKVGVVRFDVKDKGDAEISINISPHKRGLGLSKTLLVKAIGYAKKRGVRELIAEIKNENTASLKAFEGVGFTLFSDKDNVSILRRKFQE